MKKFFYSIFAVSLLFQTVFVLAGETKDGIDTGADSGTDGTVMVAPGASPSAGTYSSTQSVTLSASGAPYLCYSTNGDTPVCNWADLTCSTGSIYSSAISVSSTKTIKALACYQNSQTSSVSSFTYTISTSSSSSGGGGGGGGGSSSPNTTTPYVMPTTDSTTTLKTYRPLDLIEIEDGILPRPLRLTSYYYDYKVEIEKGTQITCEDGTAFTGTLIVPTKVSYKSRPEVAEKYEYLHILKVGDENGKGLIFSEPYKLTIPLSLEESQSPEKVGIYFYNEETDTYELLEGVLSSDGESIEIELTHMSTFAVFYVADEDLPDNIASKGETDTEDDTNLFNDIANHWAKDYINTLAELGIVKGQSKGTYAPDAFINRAEFVTIMSRTFEWDLPSELTSTEFTDVNTTDWFATYVQVAFEKGIIEGNTVDGIQVFRPEDQINRAEAMKVILLAAGITDFTENESGFEDVPSDAWFANYVTYAKNQGIVSGKSEGIFAPAESLTRGEIAKILVLLMDF